MLRIHFMQTWFTLSDAATEEALHDTVRGTAGNVEANRLLHGQESDVFADAGYQGAAKRPDVRAGVTWRIAMRLGERRALDKGDAINALVDKNR